MSNPRFPILGSEIPPTHQDHAKQPFGDRTAIRGKISAIMPSNNWRISGNPLNQIRLLGLLTGCHRDFDAKATFTTKDTDVLIDAIHNFRNRSQHPDGQSIHLGVAVAAIMSCLELLACLDRESPA